MAESVARTEVLKMAKQVTARHTTPSTAAPNPLRHHDIDNVNGANNRWGSGNQTVPT